MKLEYDQFKCFAASILALLLFCVLTSYQGSKRASNLPPFVKSGFIETLRRFTSRDAAFELLRWARESGPVFRLRLPYFGGIYVSNDLSLTLKVLGDKDSYKPQKVYRGLIKETMFNCEGFRWKHVRKSVSHAFSANHIRRMSEVSSKQTNDFMTMKLDKFVGEGSSFDLCSEMLSLTFSIICEAAFEYDISQEEIVQCLKDIKNLLIETRYRAMPFRKTVGNFFPAVKAAKKSLRSLQDLGEKMLISFREKKLTKTGTVINCIANDKDYQSDSERVNDILVFLIAGHDTTAFSIAWILLELAKNSHEQETLRNELKKLPIEERLNSSALKHIIKEGMRLHPVAAIGSVRDTARDFSLKLDNSERSVHIPKGSTVFCPLVLILRNARYFNKPDEFMPSRWINPSPDAISAFIPFSSGKRNCIGQPLANAELQTVISHLIGKYHFSVEDSGEREFYVTLKPAGARLIASRCH